MKILPSIIFLLLLAAPASAAKVQKLSELTTVNALIQNGWKLHTVSSSDYIITYTLTRPDGVITCKVDSKGRIECFKP